MKMGKLTLVEKTFIECQMEKMSVGEIAKHLDRNVETIKRYIKVNCVKVRDIMTDSISDAMTNTTSTKSTNSNELLTVIQESSKVKNSLGQTVGRVMSKDVSERGDSIKQRTKPPMQRDGLFIPRP